MMSNKELGTYLKHIRESLGYSTYDVNKLCKISQSYISLMENGKRRPSPIILKKVSSIYNINYIDLYEKAGYIDLAESEKLKNNMQNHKSTTVFIYNSIPANVPIECIEDVIDTEEISESMLKNNKEYFGFKINDDTMEPDYIKGDVIILEKTEKYINGEDCIVMINGNDGIFKRVFINENGIILQPLNNSYQPVIYSNNQINSLPVKIVGVVRELRRKK